jgi:hypothetical protein
MKINYFGFSSITLVCWFWFCVVLSVGLENMLLMWFGLYFLICIFENIYMQEPQSK